MDKLFVAYEEAKENTINGDFIDKLHSKITVLILFVISILIGIKQFEGKWLSSHFFFGGWGAK